LDICLANRWGEPVYTLTSLAGGTGAETNQQPPRLYIYRVAIPHFPFPYPHNQFQSYSWRPSLEEARIEAAQFVLACLRISPDYVYNSGSSSSSNSQGGPLASHPQVI
jgi:hypothetical protein